MRKEQLRTYLVKRNSHLKDREIIRLKNKRKAFNVKKGKTTERALIKRVGKRNYQVLTKRQKKRYQKTTRRHMAKSKKLRYKKMGGDIAYGDDFLKSGNWIDNFVSSNVYKFRRQGQDLWVQFLDGSIYRYFGVGNQFIGFLNTGSKGKWVWRALRRKQINYIKVR